MAQLLLIKDANTPQKEVDDIVGFYEDNHNFNPWAMNIIFSKLTIEGYTREHLVEFARNKQPKRKRIYKLPTANEWTDVIPYKEIAWKHSDGKWYMLVETPRYMFTIKNMTEQEKITVADEQATTFDKLNALAHLECKIDMDIKNMVEITELNQ